MMVSAAFFAPTSPPDTGASTYSQPSSLMRFANFFVSIGEIELMSTTILPRVSPSATPFAPNSTFSTSGVSGTMVMMMSAFCATSFALAHALPPAAVSSCGTPLRLCRKSVWPPLMRFSAMGLPMMPRPTNPMLLIAFLLLDEWPILPRPGTLRRVARFGRRPSQKSTNRVDGRAAYKMSREPELVGAR